MITMYDELRRRLRDVENQWRILLRELEGLESPREPILSQMTLCGVSDESKRLLFAVAGVLRRITYKPTWRFHIEAEPETMYRPWYVHVHLYYSLPSIDDPMVDSQLTTQQTFTANALADVVRYGEDAIVERVAYSLIRRAELHEMDEWLKLDGVCVRDPHPELKPASRAHAIREDAKLITKKLAVEGEWFFG